MVEATQEKAKPKEEKPAAAKDDKKKTGKEEKKDEMVSCKGRFGENEYDLCLCLKTEEDKKLEEDLNMLVQRLSVSSSCDIFSFSGFSSKAFLLGEWYHPLLAVTGNDAVPDSSFDHFDDVCTETTEIHAAALCDDETGVREDAAGSN